MSITFDSKTEALEYAEQRTYYGATKTKVKKVGSKYIVEEVPCIHKFERVRTSGNPYEGGSIHSKCSKCGMMKNASEDGVYYYNSQI
jgi:hypothetical protein